MKGFINLLTSVNALLTANEQKRFDHYKSMDPYMEISYSVGNEDKKARFEFELFYDKVPLTTLNFATILEGNEIKNKINLSFKNSKFHRIIPTFMMQGGDFTRGDGTGGMSIWGAKFDDENFLEKHKKGVLSMANAGENTNGSQFFITFADTPFLNGRHVVFGKLKDKCLPLLDDFQKITTNNRDRPIKDVTIIDCGFVKQKNELL